MAKNIELKDFTEVAFAIKPILETHGVPEEYHYSIISDIVFEFANVLDTRTGTSFHESVYALLEEQAEKLSTAGPDRIPVTELELEFGNGEVMEASFPDTQLDDEAQLRPHLEFMLTIRDIDEIDADIDAERRFENLVSGKKGIREVRVLPGSEPDASAWVTVDEFEASVNGLIACIRKVAGRC